MASLIRKLKNFGHGIQADIAKSFYGDPAKKILAIGVTGTDGKTTTASLIFHILETAGKKSAIITTVGAQIDGELFDTGFHTTTPSSFSIQRYIKKAIKRGCEYLVLEVTSHALDQNRVRGINFKIGVITNVTAEHLDYHGSFENYLKSKAKLLKGSEVAILNKDDKSFEELRKILADRDPLFYSIKNKDSIKLPKLASFNVSNFLAAISVAQEIGIEKAIIEKALATYKFPQGRQEIVYDGDFRIIIDFAHTPNSFASILPEIKKDTKGKLIHLFGAAGKRDKSKRPLMGELSSKYADIIILTAEDPRSEDIDDINKQIKLGIKDFKGELFEIPDRKEAIEKAIDLAKKGDSIIITGKGHEKSMNLGHGEEPWSDYAAVRNALRRISP